MDYVTNGLCLQYPQQETQLTCQVTCYTTSGILQWRFKWIRGYQMAFRWRVIQVVSYLTIVIEYITIATTANSTDLEI